MSHDFDPAPFQGTSLEDLRQYTDVLLAAAELAEALDSQPPRASDHFYRVSDPTIIEIIDIPEDIRLILVNEPLKSIAFWVERVYRERKVVVESAVTLEFEDMNVHLKRDGDEACALFEEDEERPIPLSASEVSNIIARLTHPTNDPMFSDFQKFDDPAIVEEVCETLKNEDFITTSIERVYEVEGYQVITQFQNERLVSCIITDEDINKEYPIALEVEFKHFQTASNLYQILENGSRQLILDVDDLERYSEIIQKLKKRIAVDETPNGTYLD